MWLYFIRALVARILFLGCQPVCFLYLTFDDFGSLHLAFILLRNIPVIFFIYFWFIFLGEF